MRVRGQHAWKIDPKEAVRLQRELAGRVIVRGVPAAVRYIAGADISTQAGGARAYAGVVVLGYPSLDLVERRGASFKLSFPYIPGLLAFREAPPLIDLFRGIRHEPDIVLFDGQGIAHPRGLGIASHLGLLLNKPSIGCAKSLLYGHYTQPAREKGSFSYLYNNRNAVIGAVLRTREGVRPVFASVGHRMELYSVLEWILATCRGYRLPEPTRQAHLFVNELRQARA